LLPRCYEKEEEFVLVVEGAPRVWIDGNLHQHVASNVILNWPAIHYQQDSCACFSPIQTE
jgi:hypothetical protein